MKARLIRRLLAAIPLAVIGTVITLAQHGTASPQAAMPETSQTLPSSAPTSTPQVTINGHHVMVDGSGSANVWLPGEPTHVQISPGNTIVDSSTDGNLDVQVSSGSGNSINHHTSTQVTNTQTTQLMSSGGSSKTTTHVFSTGSANVLIGP